jgi:hypothetical protein
MIHTEPPVSASEGPPDPAASPEPREPLPGGQREEDLDLDDLERLGVEGVVARMRAPGQSGGDEVEDDAPPPRFRRGRSPVVAVLVAAFGAYLLASMGPDMAYWLSSRTPLALGHAGDFFAQGGSLAEFDQRLVRITGTPDVQHAARVTTKERFLGFRRITEGGGRLFAAIPRARDQPVTNTFEGTFEGRVRPLAQHAAGEWVRQFFDGENIVRAVDASVPALAEALTTGAEALETTQGRVAVGREDLVRLVIVQPEVTVQIGRQTVPRAQEATRRMAALGVPWAPLGLEGRPYHAFVARISEAERAQAGQQLLGDVPSPPHGADPGVGVSILPRTTTYGVPLDKLELVGDRLRLPVPPGVDAGFDLAEGKLVPRAAGSTLEVELSSIKTVRVELPVRVADDARVIVVGETPADLLQTGILWLLVLLITLLNVASLGLWARRRLAARSGT